MPEASDEGRLVWPPNKEDLERLYLVEKLSAAKIAKAYNLKYKNAKVAESTVLYELKKNGIKRRDRADHVRKVTEAIVDDWVGRYKAGESLKQIAGKGLSPVTVFLHLRKRGLQLRDKVEAQIQAVTKYARKSFIGDLVERAYLMGIRYGDLNVVKHGRAIRVRVSTTHPAMAELFESLFSPYGQVHRYPRRAKFTGFEWTLECDLERSFEFMLFKPTIDDLEAFTQNEFYAFLAGIFDAEGSIYMHRRRYGVMFEVSITNTESELLSFFEKGLRRLGYHPRIEFRIQDELRLGYPKKGEIYVLRISIQDEVCRLLSEIRFRHPEKVAKAEFVLQRVCKDDFGAGADEVEDWEVLTRSIKMERDAFVNLAKESLENRKYVQTEAGILG